MEYFSVLLFIVILLFLIEFRREKRIDLERQHYQSAFKNILDCTYKRSIYNLFLIRIFDIIVSLGIIVLVLPILYLILGFIIKLTSSGPIIFVQKRVGIFNKSFDCYKFRSMYDKVPDVTACLEDSRITRIGRFIRKSHLDEFPQFINVFRGDMSVVGPRPWMHSSYDELEKVGYERLIVRPGITGWAQINSPRFCSVQDRINMDMHYIQNISWKNNLKIILKTLKFKDK